MIYWSIEILDLLMFAKPFRITRVLYNNSTLFNAMRFVNKKPKEEKTLLRLKREGVRFFYTCYRPLKKATLVFAPQKRSTMLTGETKSNFYDLKKSHLMECWYAEQRTLCVMRKLQHHTMVCNLNKNCKQSVLR